MCSLGVSDQMEDVTTKGRSIAVCVWLVMVGIAADVECSGQGTMATQMSNSPLMNSRKPVSSRMGGWDGRKMLNSTNAAGRSVAQVTMAVGVPIVLCFHHMLM
ncbi:uncharacterized protein LOC132385351 isoform X2 [Hypanus sabinus]|uniref:uncharacterized protein LOC132385351 isoform X2 n=1 Tax=Hypanus sabinus TaxID=79690 RepID=UPI0028C4EF35|nr:uncharacterized protein LOC132385351 isoform X2 [Hypanus sabinus]